MTVMALRMAAASNGVSKLHGQVSRKMWQGSGRGCRRTRSHQPRYNGVHFRSWISYEMNQLYNRYLGPEWREEPAEYSIWKRSETIPGEELWRQRARRERLVAFVRRQLRAQLERRALPRDVEAADECWTPDALTIGFARRFATYKRAALILRDPERLERLLNAPGPHRADHLRGKSASQDDAGKDLIRQIVSLARRKEFRRRLVFLEEYDMAVSATWCREWTCGSILRSGPWKPAETSGMKAAANGALNLSTLDGWWTRPGGSRSQS